MFDRHLWCKRIDCAGRLKRTAVLKVDLVSGILYIPFDNANRSAYGTVANNSETPYGTQAYIRSKDIARDRIKRERATDENAEDDVLARAAFA
jgi:hypothetical protein